MFMRFYSQKIIHKDILINNFLSLQKISNKNICAVVKANAYGHDSKTVVKILNDYCNFFAVQNLYEALQIRKVTNKTILVLGYCIDYLKAIENNISITVENLQQLYDLIKLNKNVNIHLKINTGMNRLGIKSLKTLKKCLNLIKNNKKINIEGVFTHFFCSSDYEISQNQMRIFNKYVAEIKKSFNPIIHIGGSGMINYNFDADYIRCGISLYGYNCKYTKPVMEIKSKILKITNIKKGEFVGYDCFFKANKNMRIGLVPLGYADGIVQNVQIFYNNHILKCVGKVCMDMFMVDISNIKLKNNVVTVFKNAYLWQKNCNPYHVLTSLNNARCDIVVI